MHQLDNEIRNVKIRIIDVLYGCNLVLQAILHQHLILAWKRSVLFRELEEADGATKINFEDYGHKMWFDVVESEF